VFHIRDFIMWGMDSGPLRGRGGSDANWAPPQELKSKAEKGVLDSMSEWLTGRELEEELSEGAAAGGGGGDLKLGGRAPLF